MIILDTHVWIWWVHGSDQLTEKQSEAIRQNEQGTIGISAISVLSTILCKIIFSHIFNKWQVAGDFSYGLRSPIQFHL